MTLKCALCMFPDPNTLPARGRVIEDAVTVIEGTAVCFQHKSVVATGLEWHTKVSRARERDAKLH